MQTKVTLCTTKVSVLTLLLTAVVNGTPMQLTAYNVSGSGTPGVVTIDQLNQRAGFIETGPFDVRIILTEEPKGGLTTDMILVEGGGSATAVTKGVSLRGALLEITDVDAVVQALRDSELTTAIATYYIRYHLMIPPCPLSKRPGAATLPEATGRDNMYHQYFVTIEPNPGVSGNLTISLALFEDNVIPTPNRYIPLTSEQRVATRLSAAQKGVRDTRVLNETLTVAVAAGADTTSVKALATAAYETRLNDDPKGIINLNPNLDRLDVGLVIPANGYLVLVRGAADFSSVVSVSAKIAEKLTDAQKLYNVVYGFELPHPATDLDTFFRNGGTIQLVHGDLPDATDSGTDESKAKPVKDGKPDTAHADYAGYDGATTKAYAEGEVVISEVMWGGYGNQYLELHNTTDAPIGIDHLEWAIAIGSAPDAFTVIDTIGNNPTTGYWEVPGSDFIILEAIANRRHGVITSNFDVSCKRCYQYHGSCRRRHGRSELGNLYT